MSHRSRSISARSFELCAAGRTLVDIGVSDIRPTPVRLMTSARPIRSGGCFYINCIRRIAVIRRHGYPAPPRGIRGGGTAAGHRIRDPFYADLPPAALPTAYRHNRRWQPLDRQIQDIRLRQAQKKTTDLKVCRSIIALLHPFSAPCGEWGIRTPGTVTRTAV